MVDNSYESERTLTRGTAGHTSTSYVPPTLKKRGWQPHFRPVSRNLSTSCRTHPPKQESTAQALLAYKEKPEAIASE